MKLNKLYKFIKIIIIKICIIKVFIPLFQQNKLNNKLVLELIKKKHKCLIMIVRKEKKSPAQFIQDR